jgi:competence protein ComEA
VVGGSYFRAVLPSRRSREGARDADLARARLSSLTPPLAEPFGAEPAPEREPDLDPDAVGGAAGRPRSLVPAGLRDARLVAPRQAVAGLVVVALLSAVVTAAVLWSVRPHASAVEPPLVGAPAERPAGAAPSPSARSLVVSVVGRVRHPGLVALPVGARLIDALKAAGGPLPGVDLTALNLARKVADGEQIVVGGPAAAAGAAPSGTADAPAGGPAPAVNLNSATLAELDTLPGIGPVIAQRILDWRSAHGGFTNVDQLRDVSGIGDRTFERLRDLVTV